MTTVRAHVTGPTFTPKLPWQRVYIDFAGPFMGKMFLIVFDSHSKWFKVEIMPSIATEATS